MKERAERFAILAICLMTTIACDGRHSRSGRGQFVSGAGGFSKNDDSSAKSRANNQDAEKSLDSESLQRGPETLIWKRYRPFENNLMSGLGLSKSEVCMELGKRPCVDEIHLAVMGGNEPYENAQYERAKSPTILTSVAVERIVLAACDKRLSIDKTLGTQAVVFKHFKFNNEKVSTKKLVDQAEELYRRLLSRNPTEREIEVFSDLLGMNLSTDELALGMCFVVGTQAESLFL